MTNNRQIESNMIELNPIHYNQTKLIKLGKLIKSNDEVDSKSVKSI